jgi:hypothetical protein
MITLAGERQFCSTRVVRPVKVRVYGEEMKKVMVFD